MNAQRATGTQRNKDALVNTAAREERYQIYALWQAGQKRCKIAAIMNRDKSTISRCLIRTSENCGAVTELAPYEDMGDS